MKTKNSYLDQNPSDILHHEAVLICSATHAEKSNRASLANKGKALGMTALVLPILYQLTHMANITTSTDQILLLGLTGLLAQQCFSKTKESFTPSLKNLTNEALESFDEKFQEHFSTPTKKEQTRPDMRALRPFGHGTTEQQKQAFIEVRKDLFSQLKEQKLCPKNMPYKTPIFG